MYKINKLIRATKVDNTRESECSVCSVARECRGGCIF